MKVRALITVKRIDETCFETVINTRRELDYGMQAWLQESISDIEEQLDVASKLKDGQAMTLLVMLNAWSDSYETYYGTERDAGWDVWDCKVIRKTKEKK